MPNAEDILQYFLMTFKQADTNLAMMNEADIVILIGEWQKSIAENFSLTVDPTSVAPSHIESLVELFGAENCHNTIVLRHGERQKDAEVLKITDEASQKIRMMQEDNNIKDPITVNSAIDFIATMIVFAYLQTRTDKTFSIETSENKRASIPALALGQLLCYETEINDIWKCINYPMDPDKLALLKDGKLPWDKDVVNALLGDGEFEKIVGNVRNYLQVNPSDKNTVRVVMTHAKQFNAASEILDLEVSRPGFYGYMVCGGENPAELFVDGVQTKTSSALQYR